MKTWIIRLGGAGSGNFGHSGRPGKVGGSISRSSSFSRKAVQVTKVGDWRIIDSSAKVLPQEHLDTVSSIKSGVPSPDNIIQGSCSRSGDITLYNDSEKTYYSRKWDWYTVKHEIGHSVHNSLDPSLSAKVTNLMLETAKGKTLAELTKEYLSAQDSPPLPGFPTRYSMGSVNEFFADCYATYVENPKHLGDINPDMYGFLRDSVFRGVEYG